MRFWLLMFMVVFVVACSAQSSETSLVIGGVQQVSSLRLALLDVVEDSRCSAGVQCVWAGRVVANVSVQGGSWSENVLVGSDSPMIVGNGLYNLELVKVFPDKVEGIRADQYRLTFRVTALKS